MQMTGKIGSVIASAGTGINTMVRLFELAQSLRQTPKLITSPWHMLLARYPVHFSVAGGFASMAVSYVGGQVVAGVYEE